MISSIGNTGSTNVSQNITRMHERMLNKIDTNADGSVSKEEFVSNRPKEVSEDQANEMWSKLDTGGKGGLTGSEFLAAMSSQGPPPGGAQGPPPGPPPGRSDGQGNSSVSSSTSDTATSELLQALLAAIDKYVQSSNTQNQQTSTNTVSSYA